MVGVIVSFITTSKISFVAFGFKFSDFIHWAFITWFLDLNIQSCGILEKYFM
jgi:hypothetical protein